MEPSTKSYVITKDHSNILLFLAGMIGISFMVSGFYISYQKSVLSFSGSFPNAIKSYFKENYVPRGIEFINLGVKIPVEAKTIKNGKWDVSDKSASFLTNSAKIGENGNIVIYGPGTKSVFGAIKDVKIGNFINLTSENDEIYSYVVKEIKVVSPSENYVISPTDHEVLTVFTSTGFLDNKRFVIKAYPIND